jgi:hypothetical protein
VIESTGVFEGGAVAVVVAVGWDVLVPVAVVIIFSLWV